ARDLEPHHLPGAAGARQGVVGARPGSRGARRRLPPSAPHDRRAGGTLGPPRPARRLPARGAPVPRGAVSGRLRPALMLGIFFAARETLLGGYDAIEQGFSSGDYAKPARGREAMEAWRREIEAVAGELRELMEHFGIEAPGVLESRSRPGVLQRSTQRTKSSARPAATA